MVTVINMICLAKNSDIIKDLAKNLKSNKDPLYTYCDDLFALSLVEKYNLEVSEFYYCNDYQYRQEATQIKDYIESVSKNTYTISTKTFEAIALKDNASNMIAKIKLPLVDINSLKDKEFIVVVDKIELPGNLGTILRTMDAVKADALISVDPFTKLNNPKLIHSSRGMNLLIPQCEVSYNEALEFFKNDNFSVFLGEPELGQSYEKYNYKGKIAIVVGSERYGINPNWYNHEHKKVFIPMEGEMGSLNVGVAASILMYEAHKNKRG